MKSLLTLFKIDMDTASEAFETERYANNKRNLIRIVIVFSVLQVLLACFRFIQIGAMHKDEVLFYGVCLFLSVILGVVALVGKEPFFRTSVFLVLFVAAIYSWYGSIVDFGSQLYFLVLLLVGMFIIDAEGFRMSSMVSAVIYSYAIISHQTRIYLPDEELLSLILLLAVLWFYTEQKHKQAISAYNRNKELKEQYEQLEVEIEYRDTLTERLMESEQKFRIFMNHVPAALLVVDSGKITYANKSTIKLTGYSREELEYIDWIDLLDYEDALMLSNRIENTDWEAGMVRDYTVKLINKVKRPVWMKIVITDIKFDSRNVKLVSGYDITSQKHYEAQLNKLVRMKEDMLLLTQSILGIDDIGILYDIILDGAIDSVEMADRGSILLVDQDGLLKAEAYRGYKDALMKDFRLPVEESFLYLKTGGQMHSTEIINDLTRLSNVKLYDTQKEHESPAQSSIGTPIYHHGELFGMVYLDSPLKNAFKEEDYMMVDFLRTQIEMAINKQALMDEAVYLSRYDKLTGIFNRRWFEEYYQTMEAKAKRYNDDFAFVMFDLNGLKQINDLYGHLEGDEMIKGFTSRLKELTRASDVLARFGGDEFVGIFHEITPENLKNRLDAFADSLVTVPIKTKERQIICRFSYGAAYFRVDSDDYETLVKIADERMYAMKAGQEKSSTKALHE